MVRALVVFFITLCTLWAEQVYLAPEKFIAQSFDQTPEVQYLWMNPEIKEKVKKTFGKAYPGFRVKYWKSGNRTAWILGEIGKCKPITTGYLVEGNEIKEMRVLIYRESHGWEVRYPFFTKQFSGVHLEKPQKLSRSIYGISGATLSVNALTRLARLALLFHSEVKS